MTIWPLQAWQIPQMAQIERLCFSDPWSQKALEEELTTAYELAGTKFNHNKIVKIIKFLTNKRMVIQESRGIYRFMPDYHY